MPHFPTYSFFPVFALLCNACEKRISNISVKKVNNYMTQFYITSDYLHLFSWGPHVGTWFWLLPSDWHWTVNTWFPESLYKAPGLLCLDSQNRGSCKLAASCMLPCWHHMLTTTDGTQTTTRGCREIFRIWHTSLRYITWQNERLWKYVFPYTAPKFFLI